MQNEANEKMNAATVKNSPATMTGQAIVNESTSAIHPVDEIGRQPDRKASLRQWRMLDCLPGLLFLMLAAPILIFAQSNYEHTKDKVDQTLRSNARINPSTLAVELSIPLADLPGRGGTSMPLVFNYSSKVWELEATGANFGQNGSQAEVRPLYSQKATAGWTTSYDAPSIDPTIEPYDCNGNGVSGTGSMPFGCVQYYYVKRIRVTLPGGSTHELRKDDLIYSSLTTMDKTGTYYAVDGTRVRLEWNLQQEPTLLMPDGGRYLFNTSLNCTKYIDRSGNTLFYNSTTKAWTDTLGRTLAAPFSALVAQTERTQSFTLPGMGTSLRTFQIVWKKLSSGALITGTNETLKYVTEVCGSGLPARSPLLFTSTPQMLPCDGTSGYFDPVVISEIILPTGQKYKFAYTAYGEIARIDYPTGAYEKFTYNPITALGWDYQTNHARATSYGQANRGVVERLVGADDVTPELQWLYAAGYQTTITYGTDTYVMTTTAPDNTKSKRFLYRAKRPVNNGLGDYGFDTILAGMEMETQLLDANNVIRARKLFEWETTDGAPLFTGAVPQRDARIKREINLTFDPASTLALATMSETFYDTNDPVGSTDPAYFAALNAEQTKSYHFVTENASTAQTATLATAAGWFSSTNLASRSETDYLYDANYKARNICGLAIDSRVIDPATSQVKAKSHIDYDEATYLEGVTVPNASGWTNPNTAYCGLPTTTKVWNDTNGSWIDKHAMYDQFGNVKKSWDGKGNVSEIQYTDNYTDGLNRNSYAFPTKTISAAPGGNGSSLPFESTIKYDFNTGLTTSTTDANGLETRMEYVDSMLRPTKVSNYYSNQAVGSQTITEYGAGTTPATRFVKVRTQIDAVNWKEAYSGFDGLGRTIRTQSIDSNGDVFTDTQYDSKGRVWKTSNPYRTGETVYWTENIYDAELGRPIKVKTPDNAEVNTAYSLGTGTTLGTIVTVTDQALKQRRSITNALGQLTRVDEPNDANSLGTVDVPTQPTLYAYDPLNNLKTVTQAGTTAAQCGGAVSSCTQTRSFLYDSLSRLKSATNPEMGTTPTTGTISYTYDNNGNLQTKIDANNITTTYGYDNLNRVISRTYTGEPVGQNTPAVNYYYDNLTNAKGKLIKVSSLISMTEYTAFDTMGRVTAHRQTTDGTAYSTAYSYNLAGTLLTETYPSTRIVKNVLDADGDVSMVQSRKNTFGGYWNYAQHFSYTSAGAVNSMQLGNGKWESTTFNSRLQPMQIALGTVQNGTDNLLLNYTFSTTPTSTDNNGNVLTQKITVPTTNGTPGFVANQAYTYDSLNRLNTAEEITPGQAGWKQTFTYDRFGNRRFDTASSNTTTGPANCQTASCGNPTIDPSTNKLVGFTFDNAGNTKVDASGKTFTYDAENKQTKVMSGNVRLGLYAYDGDGKRVKKIEFDANDAEVETTIFVYDASGKMVAEYSTYPKPASTAQVSYLTNDNLGSPRVTTDKTGKVFSRRDFMPFGEEIKQAQTAQRSVNLNYSSDEIRQKFTSYERDNESDLDFAQARMYSSKLGRFTSVDPLMASARISNPKTWNRYGYALNNPLKYVDPDGMDVNILDAEARKLLLLTLPEKIREKVQTAIEKGKGNLTKGSLDKIKSDDENFAALKTMVNAKAITEAATSDKGENGIPFSQETHQQQYESDIQAYMKNNNVSRAAAEKVISPPTNPNQLNYYRGQTYTPNGEDGIVTSPSGNLRAVTTDRTGVGSSIPEENAVVTFGHELYGHAYYFGQGNKTWMNHGKVITVLKTVPERIIETENKRKIIRPILNPNNEE